MARLAVLENLQGEAAPAQGGNSKQEEAFRASADRAAHPASAGPAEAATYHDLTANPNAKRRKFWAVVEDWYEHKRLSYAEPLSADELQATFVEKSFGAWFPEAPESAAEAISQVHELTKEGFQTWGKNAFETYRNLLTLKALNGEDPEQILKWSRTRDAHVAFMTREASLKARRIFSIFNAQVKTEADLSKIAESRVARVSQLADDNSAAIQAVTEVPEEVRKGREAEFADLLSGFGSEFPSRAAPVSEFAREKVLASWGIANTNDAGVRIARAANFEKLQSYSRVGGILFGRDLAPGRSLDVPGFWWETKDGSLSLFLQRRGAAHPAVAGPFAPYLIRQALAYAADQRPTVVTLLLTPDIGRKQVMLHPAFRDTGLGCRLIAADQWIFHYTDPNPKNPKSSAVRSMIDRYSIESGLYSRAWEALHDPTKHGGLATAPLTQFLHPKELSPLGNAPGIQRELLQTHLLQSALIFIDKLLIRDRGMISRLKS